MKVWIVMKAYGGGSDWLEAVFATKDLAEEHIARIQKGEHFGRAPSDVWWEEWGVHNAPVPSPPPHHEIISPAEYERRQSERSEKVREFPK